MCCGSEISVVDAGCDPVNEDMAKEVLEQIGHIPGGTCRQCLGLVLAKHLVLVVQGFVSMLKIKSKNHAILSLNYLDPKMCTVHHAKTGTATMSIDLLLCLL